MNVGNRTNKANAQKCFQPPDPYPLILFLGACESQHRVCTHCRVLMSSL